jgi:L-2-hydroxyglutarate oxidase LhgO
MDTEILIIGGGVVGLACAAESASRGHPTLLVERHESFGQDTSSRNSEVLHSGIYYPSGSLKARLCVTANENLYAECAREGVWTRRCGKLIVAVTPEEEPALEKLHRQGLQNGVPGMELLDAAQVRVLEPGIRCVRAISLPSTGILDSHGLMKVYLSQARAHGADVAFGIEFLGGERRGDAYRLMLKDTSGEPVTVTARSVVNSAGLFSDTVAQSFGIDVDAAGYRLHHNRGHYYTVSSAKSGLVSRLVYPMPHPHLVFVGIHITIDRAGQIKLGPDTEYLDPLPPEAEWYKFDDTRREKFHSAVHRYFPALEREDLSPGQVGVRPKVRGSENSFRDFIIAEESARGLPGLVNLVNIESPGLTCAREIAREVLRTVEERHP